MRGTIIAVSAFSLMFAARPAAGGALAADERPALFARSVSFEKAGAMPTPPEGEEMIDLQAQSLITGVLAVPAMVSGYRLARSGRPYDTLTLTVHKLTALAMLVVLNRAVWEAHRSGGLDGGQTTAAVAMNVFFAGTMVSGGWIAASDSAPDLVHTAHRAGPWLSLVSAGALLYLLGR